jgi:hypothetical protein
VREYHAIYDPRTGKPVRGLDDAFAIPYWNWDNQETPYANTLPGIIRVIQCSGI